MSRRNSVVNRSAGETNVEQRSNWPPHRRRGWPDQRESDLYDAAGEPERNADPPRHGVGTERVVKQSSPVSAQERAELMAHEGEPLDHRLPFQPEHLGDRPRDQRP